MPSQPLVTLCTKACIKNVRSLSDVGDFEYWKIRPVLSRVSNPEQLHEIELASPQILGEDAELWRAFIARDIPDWKKKNYIPKNPLKWYEVYLKYRKEQKAEIERDKDRLKEAMMGLQKEKASHVSKVVEAKYLPKLPKDPRMLANNGGVPIGGRKKGFAKPGSSILSWNAGSKTKMKDPASVLTRARREAKEISSRNKLGKPTHQLGARPSQVLKAPRGMVNEYRKAAEPQIKIFTPRANSSSMNNRRTSGSDPSARDREDRLRALTAKHIGNNPNVTIVGSDSDTKISDDGLDDLFGDRRSSSPPLTPARPYSSSALTTKVKPHPKPARPPKTIRTAPRANPSEVKPTPESKPSDIISSIISKPKPQQATASRLALASPQSSPSPPKSGLARDSSPMPRPSPGPSSRPMVRKRRPEVDIFNRAGAATKKPRVVR